MKKGLKEKREAGLEMLWLEGAEECSKQGGVPHRPSSSSVIPTEICCEDKSGMTAESLWTENNHP